MSRAFWRTGTKVGRTLYRDEKLVGLVDTPELAAELVLGTRLRETFIAEVRKQIARCESGEGCADPDCKGQLEDLIEALGEEPR